jgi:hypothetical protein
MRAFFLTGTVDWRIGAQLDFYRHSGRREAAIRNLEIPGSCFARPGMTAMGTSRYD